MKINANILALISLCCFCICKGGIALGQSRGEAVQDTIRRFTLPSIPSSLTTVGERADYLVRHYWDSVDFADAACLSHPDIIEQAWVDYCDILNHVPLMTARESMRNTVERAYANREVFDSIVDLADKYLCDPASPMRNEEFYIPVLEAMIAAPLLDDMEKLRPKAQLELAKKNRIGSKAENFKYTSASGKRSSLYRQKADYIVLFINDPGCHVCMQTLRELKKATAVNRMLQHKRLLVLSVYSGEEVDRWRRHLDDFPKEWINGYDRRSAIEEQRLYDLQVIPTLYLLDKEKVVLLKDASVQAIEDYLSRQQ